MKEFRPEEVYPLGRKIVVMGLLILLAAYALSRCGEGGYDRHSGSYNKIQQEYKAYSILWQLYVEFRKLISYG